MLACATAAGLCLCECLLRLTGISYPQFYAPDPHCASRLLAGASGWWISEGRAFVRINSDALRDREHLLRKPADVVRVAVLGDSYTEALQVDAGDAFWAVAERELKLREPIDGREVEFVNFGVSGYGTAQELLMLRHHVWKYDPDVVIAAFCHNDIQDNSRALSGIETRPYFLIQGDDLNLDSSFRTSDGYLAALTPYEQWKTRILNCSYTLQVLKQARMNWQLRRERSTASTRGFEEMGSDFDVYEAPESEAGRTAWEVTERLIVELNSDVVNRNRKFGLMTLTTPLQAHPTAEVRNRISGQRNLSDLFYSEHRLTKLAGRHGFPILTLARPLQKFAESRNVFLHGFPNTEQGAGHWNETGHDIAGQHLAQWLEDEVLK